MVKRQIYTVTINHGEYAKGIFRTKTEANAFRAGLIRAENPDIPDEMSVEEVLEECDCDGYFGILLIWTES